MGVGKSACRLRQLLTAARPTTAPVLDPIFDRLAADDMPTGTAELILAAYGGVGAERTVEIGPGPGFS